MNKSKIAFFDSKPYDIASFDEVNKGFQYDIKYFESHLKQDTAMLAKDHNIVCAFVNDSINSETIDILKHNKIELIALRCAGYNNVDLKYVYNKIHVVRVPAYSPYAVAEHAVALLLTLVRKTHRAFYRNKELNFNINGLLGFDLFGKTIGVIGTGKIGRIFIDILKGFGVNILAFDPYPDDLYAKEKGIEFVDLDTLYAQANIISLHCPLTEDTKYIINWESIKKMKDGVVIINTSRGALIDTKALIAGLKSNKIGAAGLDVYEEESEYFFEDFSNSFIPDDTLARLLTFPNVLITSHQGFFTKEALQNIAQTTLTNIKDYLEGNKLVNEICYRCEEFNASTCRHKKEGRCF